ncbi:MAG: CHAT domain-containing protein, partial [Microthrixaceae bacterium]|nr:CHAT domain-containing protein [Microthrixaceae bacterium]
MQLLRYAQEAPSRLGVLRPQSDVLAAITGLLRPAATEILDVLADVGPDRPVAVIGDGFSRSLPWPAVPIGQNEHIVDRISWVHEPTLELIRTEPTPVPRLTAVLDGDRGHTLRWAKEESSWIVKRRHGLTFDPDVDNQIGTDPFLLHACAHGIADPVDPRQSGLVVHNTFTDTPLFLRASDLVALNAVPTMMVLSACSMGHAGLTWEASAMASPVTDTFRASGVAAVTSYLSPCSDRSAFVLSTYLHYRLEGGATLEEAVRSTQLWAKRSSDRELRSWVTSNTTIETLSDPALLRRAGTWGTLSVSGW